MKIFDSETTERGTLRKIYCRVEFNKEARRIAKIDINADINAERKKIKSFKPFKDPTYSSMEYSTYLEKWKLQQPKESFKVWFKMEREKRKILAFLNGETNNI